MANFAGIRRDSRFSPNHTGNDNAIFELTAQCLKERGIKVIEYTESDCAAIEEKYIFSMAREPIVAQMLQVKENNGAVVVNSGYGVENCYRSNMTQLLMQAGIPVPASVIIDCRKFTPDCIKHLGEKNFWIKRGDFHAIHKEDVSFVRNAEECTELIREYACRFIDTVVICKHIDGDLVKFYGVRDVGFFYWFYPVDANHSKFGNEAINGDVRNLPFQVEMLKFVASQASSVLNIDIYGGDAIITPEGAIYLIDMNDWPSFAPCRNEAAPYIANCICQKIDKNRRP
ncbi:MAG: hypothetical protein LBT50_01910 [Prevotellaceae bacterium]|jgi:hypothetical protein|nr:hypothetical protein [Prevotellaceae bacterium]